MKNLVYILLVILSSLTSGKAQNNLLAIADGQMQNGQHLKARDTYTAHIEVNTQDAEAYIKRALAYEALGNMTERNRDLNISRRLNPFADMYLSAAARSRFAAKKGYNYNWANDRKQFKKSPIKPDSYEAVLEEINFLHEQDSLISESIVLLSKNKLDECQALIEQINFNDNNVGIYYDVKGVIALKRGDVDSAIQWLDKAIDAMPLFPMAYHNRSICHKINKDYEQAEKDLRTAIDLNKNISIFYFSMAKLEDVQDNKIEALDLYEQALSKNENYSEARTNYSQLLKSLGNYERALTELDLAISQQPDNKELYYLKGSLNLTYGEYEESIDNFNYYLDDHSNDPDALFNLGLAQFLHGERKEGCRNIDISLDYEDDNERKLIETAFCKASTF